MKTGNNFGGAQPDSDINPKDLELGEILASPGTANRKPLPQASLYRWDVFLLATIAGLISICALLLYFRHDLILQYGDAVAHINIARRVFDSRRPGPSQLGTVWLPLPHILMLPFIISDGAWRTGLGGSIPSMAGYVAGVLGVFRLLRRGLTFAGAGLGKARLAAWFGALVFAANPNLIYMQSTAMGESLYMAFFVWATAFFAEFVQEHDRSKLRWCGLMLLCAMLCRYDGWFAAGCFGAAAIMALVPRRGECSLAQQGSRGVANTLSERFGLPRQSRKAFLTFVLLLAVAPSFWLAWNQFYFGNPLDWMNGPYSARAIQQRSISRGEAPHPGYHDVRNASIYYVKAAKLNLSGENLDKGGARGWRYWMESAWPLLAIAGTVLLLLFARHLWPLLLLWVPLPFYCLSVAYGGVPVFMPAWWPFSYYNVRYGLQMLPAVSAFAALTFYFLLRSAPGRIAVVIVTVIASAFVGVSYRTIWKSGPVCLHEAQENSRVRIALERQAGAALRQLPSGSTLLMQIGYYSGVLQRGGIPLKRTINETDFKLYQAALLDPARHVEYAVAAEGDQVAEAVRQHIEDFEAIGSFKAPGQPAITVYRRK